MSGIHARALRLPTNLVAILMLGACAGSPISIGGGGSGTSLNVADRAAGAGDYETAAALYQQAYDANPRSTEALLGLGRSYAGLGQFSRSEQALAEAARRNPRDPAIQLELARAQLAAGNASAALAHLDKAGGRSKRDLQFITARGIALDRLSRHKEAQETYRQGLKLAPTDFALLSNLGLSLGLSGQTSEGIRILSELNRDKKANPRTRGNLALLYGLAGRDREAAAVLSADLSSSQVQSNLAYYRELRGLLKQGKPIGNFDQPRAAAGQKAKPAAQPATVEAKAAPQTAAVAKPAVAAPPAAAASPKPPAAPLADAVPLVGSFAPASGVAPLVEEARTAPKAGNALPPASADAPAAGPKSPFSTAQ
jgi:Flp pilus assembly protein TadD